MASQPKPGGNVRITINKNINRDAARKTIERLFMMDKAVARPIEKRSANFKDLPKRRVGIRVGAPRNRDHRGQFGVT